MTQKKMKNDLTVNELYKHCCSVFGKEKIEDAEFEARLIVQKCCQLDYTAFLLEKNRSVSEDEFEDACKMLSRRIGGIPVQYILGEWDFMGLTFSVGEGVLIPRPETEQLVEYVTEKIKTMESPVVFDLCSGSGCIGLSIKHFVPQAEVYTIEISDDAIYYLEKNRNLLGLTDEVHCIKGDILEGFEGFPLLPRPNVIVSNPPYIKSAEIETLQKEVLQEPVTALDGGSDGLIFYRTISQKWICAIEKGFVAVECGEQQARDIAKLFSVQCDETEIINDFNDYERFVVGFKRN